nr:MAG TPA: hypothetical protein [Inoviridae sp.]
MRQRCLSPLKPLFRRPYTHFKQKTLKFRH